MNILSLFDGMSCGQLALKRLNISYDNYYASEIDKPAIKITQKNFPSTIQLGDIKKLSSADLKSLPKINLIMGGSPCQGFSFGGKGLNFDDPRSKLFFEFARVLKEINPKYFLLENVRMNIKSQDIISNMLEVEPIKINSSLVSAQNRVRLYWTNIPVDKILEDKCMILEDILEKEVDLKYLAGEKLQREYKGGNQLNPKFKSQCNTIYNRDGKFGTLCAGTHGYSFGYVSDGALINKSTTKNGKAYALTCSYSGAVAWNSIERQQRTMIPVCKSNNKDNPNVIDGYYYRKLTPIECERLQTVPDNYTEGVSNTQRYKMLGNGWTIDIISYILQGINKPVEIIGDYYD